MQIRFWGTRGSIPMPGKSTLRYGGNTSCVELRSFSDTLLILDSGTGIHALGQHLTAQHRDQLKGHLLISHTHWDHIQGIPFFVPFFLSGGEWDIYGPKGLGQSIQDTLSGQMQHIYFPISLTQMGATIRYHDLVEGAFSIENIKVTIHYLNHTALTCGYRFEVDGVVVVYCCDHEPYSSSLAVGQGEIGERDQNYANFLRHADLVIHEAQYTSEEYPNKKGWGHSTLEYVVKICEYAKVKRLALTHHDPLREDDALDVLMEELHHKHPKLDFFAAKEGMQVILQPKKGKNEVVITKSEAFEHLEMNTAISEQSVLVYISDFSVRSLLENTLKLDDVKVTYVDNTADFKQALLIAQPSLILIEHAPPQIDTLAFCEEICKNNVLNNIPIIVITNREQAVRDKKPGVTDWLVKPFTQSYLRSKIQAWILRMACRWARAPIPHDEEKRLLALRKLKILDTLPEERFNRIVRILVALFDMPIASLSFIDEERQWIKACVGFEGQVTSRDASFCAHVVYNREPMIVEDTFHDDRFAGNPYVINDPRLRFYAGYPLILPDGSCVGTLCVMDTRPRTFTAKEIQLLKDLRDLVMSELLAFSAEKE